MSPFRRAGVGWPKRWTALLGLVAIVGILIRIVMLPMRGFPLDLDLFASWIHEIAVGGWQHAYDRPLAFPAAMAWVWGALAAVEPSFRLVTDSVDPGIRLLMKLPASLADLGIAVAVVWWFRDRPRTAVLAASGVLLIPGIWFVSAWWGQYESLYVLPAVLAVLAARDNRVALMAALVTVSIMTKPQALPLLLPFGAWVLAAHGLRGMARAMISGAVVTLVLWLPFLPTGPVDYARHLLAYQGETFRMLSLNAWNPWYLVQLVAADGQFIFDGTALLGPLDLRAVGFAVAACFALPVLMALWREPTASRLALGLAAISLTSYMSLTTMHERYAYAGFVLLTLSIDRPRMRAAWLLLGVVFSLSLLLFAPMDGQGASSPLALAAGIGAVAMITLTVAVWLEAVRVEDPDTRRSVDAPAPT